MEKGTNGSIYEKKAPARARFSALMPEDQHRHLLRSGELHSSRRMRDYHWCLANAGTAAPRAGCLSQNTNDASRDRAQGQKRTSLVQSCRDSSHWNPPEIEDRESLSSEESRTDSIVLSLLLCMRPLRCERVGESPG
jgi:hypothetical protein